MFARMNDLAFGYMELAFVVQVDILRHLFLNSVDWFDCSV